MFGGWLLAACLGCCGWFLGCSGCFLVCSGCFLVCSGCCSFFGGSGGFCLSCIGCRLFRFPYVVECHLLNSLLLFVCTWGFLYLLLGKSLCRRNQFHHRLIGRFADVQIRLAVLDGYRQAEECHNGSCRGGKVAQPRYLDVNRGVAHGIGAGSSKLLGLFCSRMGVADALALGGGGNGLFLDGRCAGQLLHLQRVQSVERGREDACLAGRELHFSLLIYI